jgi:hypothetical protein
MDPTKNLRLLAEEAFQRANYADAERLFRQVISYLEIALGDNNVEVAITLECLARSLEMQGEHNEAEKVKDRAAQILCRNYRR